MIHNGFSSEFLDRVRAKNDIVDVVSKYVTLTRRGLNFWACCPFHNEKTPSFSVKQDGQFFKCFGCGESGNVFNLIQRIVKRESMFIMKKPILWIPAPSMHFSRMGNSCRFLC